MANGPMAAQNLQNIMYPIALTTPMSQDLTDFGFEALSTPTDVEQVFENQSGTALVVVNSVCGCAAAMARPGAKMSLESDKKPSKLYTVFAGVDTEATAKVREFLAPYPPSSPSIALFKDGKLVHFLERRHIEGRSAQVIADNLKGAYDMYC
jgi:putative YphP/YqiW family bacilliredoxin